MSWTDTENAIEAELLNINFVDVDSNPIAVEIIKDNQDDNRTEDGAPRIEVYQVATESDPLDKANNDQYSSTMQVSIFTDLGIGKALANTLKDQVISHYLTGDDFAGGGCTVWVESASPRQVGS